MITLLASVARDEATRRFGSFTGWLIAALIVAYILHRTGFWRRRAEQSKAQSLTESLQRDVLLSDKLTPVERLDLADRLRSAGSLDPALIQVNEVLAAEPENLLALRLKHNVLIDLRRSDEARQVELEIKVRETV